MKRYKNLHFRFYDWVSLSYICIMAICLLIFHFNVQKWKQLVFIHILLIFVILEMIRLFEKFPQQKLIGLLRLIYPVLLYVYFWRELDQMVILLFGEHWATHDIINLDKLLFGVHPTIWVQKLYTPVIDELANLFYSSYFLYPPIVVFTLYFKGKIREASAAISIAVFTMFANYILFILFPALGPRMVHVLESARIADFNGFWISQFTKYVQSVGSVYGACFPSSHVACGLAWVLAAYRYEKKMGLLLFPFVFGMAAATVYLGYHHAVDPVAGLLWGYLGYKISLKVLQQREEDPLCNPEKNRVVKPTKEKLESYKKFKYYE